MLAVYAREDRTLWRQRLPLPPETARRLAQRLHAADVREATFYLYHHFNDNCTTRIRDLIDEATDGALRQGAMVPSDPPLRRYVYRGFTGETLLLTLTDQGDYTHVALVDGGGRVVLAAYDGKRAITVDWLTGRVVVSPAS